MEREKVGGKIVSNRCGRDFFYYALNFYSPGLHNPHRLNPEIIECSGLFGNALPSWLIWTGLSFRKAPDYFKSQDLAIHINGRTINSYRDFILATILPRPQSFTRGIEQITQAIDQGEVCGIDIDISLWGLVDHLMFVYGYDDENLYVFDTHQVPTLEYEKLTPSDDPRFIMKLPKFVIKDRWSQFNRVWLITQTDP